MPVNVGLNKNNDVIDAEQRAQLFYMALNSLNSDSSLYKHHYYVDKNGNRHQAQVGNFYLCWIDGQHCLHHFKNGDYRHPYSSKNIFDLLSIVHSSPKKNWFIAPTTFRATQIRDEHFKDGRPNARTLTSFYLDFDVVKSGLDMDKFRNKLPVILDKCHIVPTAIINSGHGFHVYILFNEGNVVNSLKIIKYWNHIEQDMVITVKRECEKIFGKSVVDTKVKDIPRVLRVAGSYNVKDSTKPMPVKVDYLDLSSRPSFKSLMDKWRDIYKEQRNFKRTSRELSRKQRQYRKNGHTTRTLNYARCTDLFTLARLRKINGIKDGYRDLILFYYEVCAIRPNRNGSQTYTDSQTIKNVKTLNQSFCVPLGQSHVDSVINEIPKIHQNIKLEIKAKRNHQSRKTRYCPTNRTILNDLDITDTEQRHMVTIIDHTEAEHRKPNNYRRKLKRRKQRRKQCRIKRNNKRDAVDKKIIRLRESGLSIRKIAERVKISKSAVGRTIKAHNETVPKYVPFKCKLRGLPRRDSVTFIYYVNICYVNTELLHRIHNERSQSLRVFNHYSYS